MRFFADMLANLLNTTASTGTNYTLTFIFDEPECPNELL